MSTRTPVSQGLTPALGAPPLGSRLWIYTNFDCNLACDCCAKSSSRAAARRIPVEVGRRACEEFAGLGGREVMLTGGEPFLYPDLPALVEASARWVPVTILTNAMVFARGTRRRTLEGLDPSAVTMQVSLDSGTPALHDRHRGRGSFERAREGIELLGTLGFRVRVAATVDAGDSTEEEGCTRCSKPTASRRKTAWSAAWRGPASPNGASSWPSKPCGRSRP